MELIDTIIIIVKTSNMSINLAFSRIFGAGHLHLNQNVSSNIGHPPAPIIVVGIIVSNAAPKAR